MGRNSRVTIKKQLREDLKDYVYKLMRNMANETAERLNSAAYDAIGVDESSPLSTESGGGFYGSYTPKRYIRNIGNFGKRSHSKYIKDNGHKRSVRGGVVLSISNMQAIYKVPLDYVFGLVYSGYHGNPNLKIPKMEPSPYEMIKNSRDNLYDEMDSIYDSGKYALRNYTYQTLKIVK